LSVEIATVMRLPRILSALTPVLLDGLHDAVENLHVRPAARVRRRKIDPKAYLGVDLLGHCPETSI
jgi:hypothetical protein